MPCAIPEFKREVIKVKIELKQHNKSIANDTSVSERTIRAYKKNLRDHGTLCPPKAVLQGRRRKITPEMQEVCVNTYQRCCQKLMFSRSLICCVHVLLCTLMSKSIICGMPLVFRLTSNVLNAWSKKQVRFHLLFDYNFFEFSNS